MKILEELYKLEKKGESLDLSIDKIDNFVSKLIHEENWTTCDQLLSKADPSVIRPVLAVSILTSTIAVREVLPNWNVFLNKVKKYLVIRLGVKNAALLLKGLE